MVVPKGRYSWVVFVTLGLLCLLAFQVSAEQPRASGVAQPGHSVWIQVGAHGGGLHGSRWRTDLGLRSVSAHQATVEVRFYPMGGGAVRSQTTQVTPGAQSVLEDVVGQLGGSGNGAMEVVSDRPVIITSRTYNQIAQGAACTPGGTFGQYYAGQHLADGLGGGESGWLVHLAESERFRSNIALTNMSTAEATVRVELFDGAGGLLNTFSVTVGPVRFHQEIRVFSTRAGQSNVQRGSARVTVTSGSGIIASASVIDNITGDPITIPALPADSELVGLVSVNAQGRLVKDGRAYVPSGFSADYRTRWGLWEQLLDSMAAHYTDPVVRFNLGGEAQGGLVLHADVSPGLINQQAAANVLRLVQMCRARGVGYWIVWLHRSGAGTTVPLVWTEQWDRVEPMWQASPWHRSNGGPLGHPREAFDSQYDTAWQASLDWLLDNLGNDPLFVQFELVAEGYLTDPFREDPHGFLLWQERMVRYIKAHPSYQGTIISTGDGTAMIRGQMVTHAVAGSDVYNAHIHPQPGDQKPKIVSIVKSGAPWGIYNHTQHPALSHITDKPYWNGALGYGQYVSRMYGAEEFGEVRTRLDRHAITEYIFSGNLGTGMPWDHEGHLVTYGAVSQYSGVINFYRGHSIVNSQELALRPEWRDHGDVVGMYLVGDERTLAYVFSKANWDNEQAAQGTYRIQVPTAWGDSPMDVLVRDNTLLRIDKPVSEAAPGAFPK